MYGTASTQRAYLSASVLTITHKYLYTIEGDHICGFTEECTHLIEDAIKNHQEVIDCDIDVSKFVNEVKKLQQEYETKEEE